MARLIGGESISKTNTKTKTKSKSKAFRFIYGLALNKQPQPVQSRPGQSSAGLNPCHMQHQAGSVCMCVRVCVYVPQTGVIIYT